MDARGAFAVGKEKLHQLLAWIIAVDPSELERDVALLRAQHPSESDPERLASVVFSRARWKATATGAAAGLPSTVATMLPVALADATVLYRAQANAAGRVALLYQPGFFREPDAGWELLVPIFGASSASEFLRGAGVLAGQNLSREAIRSYLSKETLNTFQGVMLRRFGVKVTQKMIFTKSIPVVGAVIGGSWNFAEVTLVRNRVIRYFSNQDLGSVGEAD
jgi:hypothetical protein